MASQNPQIPPPAVPHPAIDATQPASTGDTVTVACKLPNGLILRCFAWEEYNEPMRDGTMQKTKRAREIQEMRFTVRGTWVSSAGQAYARSNPAISELLPGGYAITPGCPREIWDLWYEQNRESMLVKNKIVFAHPQYQSAVQSAQEYRGVSSGMEPIHPDNPGERLGGVDRRLRAIGQLETDAGTSPR